VVLAVIQQVELLELITQVAAVVHFKLLAVQVQVVKA
jgi:hypothetical protein